MTKTGEIDHLNLANKGTNTHAQIDTHIADASKHFTQSDIDHANLQNKGTNTHAQIDTHIADATKHFTVGSIDHGSIAGLGDDDHPQYIKADGTRALTGAIAGVNPTASSHLATKSYVDGKIQGLDWQESVKSKGLNTPPASPTTGDRYIIGTSPSGAWAGKGNQITVWNSTAWDFTTNSEGQACWVEDEDTQYNFNGTVWVKFGSTTNHESLSGLLGGGVSDHQHLTSAQLGGLIAGNDTALHKHDGQYYTEAEIDAKFNITSGHDHDDVDSKKVMYSNLAGIPLTFTPSAHATSHRAGGSDPNVYTVNIGDGTNYNITVTHGLTAAWVTVEVIRNSTKEKILVDWGIVDSNNVQIKFGSNNIPTSNQYRVIVTACSN